MAESKYIPISCRQDVIYRTAMNELAGDLGKNVGDLVREALDEKYGQMLERHIFSITERRTQINRTGLELTNEEAS